LNRKGAVTLFLILIAHLAVGAAVVWIMPSRGLEIAGLAVVFASLFLFCMLLLRRERVSAMKDFAALREASRPEEAVASAAPAAAWQGPDRAVWEDLKKACGEIDRLLDTIPRVEAFADAWSSFSTLIENMQAASKSILENSSKTFEIASNLAGTAEKAFALSEQVQRKVKELNEELAASLGETHMLSGESKKIVGILEMMAEISSKTYVLSINASVVATRAGVHGRAFDVVAKEIRQLAQETEGSLKNIEDFVAHIQEIVRKVVDHTTVTSQEIDREKDSLLSVAGALQGVILAVEVISTVSNLSKEKAQEQQSMSDDVIVRMRQITDSLHIQSAGGIDPLKEKIRRIRQVLEKY
jgi:methyl-accepting chemotaxis protein